MARLWKNDKEIKGGKFLVLRRDGSQPEWPYFVLGARDPAAPWALRQYALMCEKFEMDPEYVRDIRRLADEFDAYRMHHGAEDPDAAPHREDDPAIVKQMITGSGS